MDTMTSIGKGTWEAVVAAAGCSMMAADAASSDEPTYAVCRPPGHHAGRDFFGGSCYVNNAALAAERLLARGAERVAIVDIDAHHGNGTQEIFYERSAVTYGSVHVDPGAGWFPHFVGYTDERGTNEGTGANLNLPVAPGTRDAEWLEAVTTLAGNGAAADALVVSLGVDAAVDDPESPLQITLDGYRYAGGMLGALRKPTVVIQEGGYHLPTLGSLVTGFLTGLADASG
jgi:acetoin utilization deacetylase AcuC-like enzyme